MRPLLTAVLATLVLAGCQTATGPSVSSRGLPTEPAASTAISGGMALNAARARHGLPRLRSDAALVAAAREQAAFMARTGAQTHAGAGGSNPGDRARRYGCSWTWVAENIAWGHRSDASAMDWWMNSPGHRRNSLSPKATHYGWATVGGQRVLVLAAGC